MVKFSTPHGLEGLFDLDRKGVDIRPTLLRVLTDQYLQSPVHTPDDVRHYTELAMRLLKETDMATRAAVSVRLAPHASAPRQIMLQLARDVLEVAEPVLLHSPVLTPGDCAAIIEDRGISYAAVLARRGKPAAGPASEPALATHAAPMAQAQIPSPPPSIVDQSYDDVEAGYEIEALPDEDAAADPHARELCELFFAASSAERRLILLNLDYSDWPTTAPPAPLQRADIWRLETAALRHHTGTLMRELERALGISHRQARRIVEDDLGEPIVIAGKAMSLPADVLQRIVLFMNPRVGHSVDRVYELSALYTEISIEAARRLISILRAAEPVGPTSRDSRSIYAAAESGRRTLSEFVSTVTRKPETMPRIAAAAGEN
jgi:hypothetical protein